MNEIIQSLYDRKSVRAFEGRPVPAELKAEILAAAAQAPTAGCQQLYTILDITDQALKEALAETCDHQPFIAQAPVVLVFCADCLRWYDAYRAAGLSPRRPGPGDLMLAVTDAAIAAQNAVVAAQSLGLGSCYIGDIMERYEDQRKLLHLPPLGLPRLYAGAGLAHPAAKGAEKAGTVRPVLHRPRKWIPPPGRGRPPDHVPGPLWWTNL